MTHDEIVAEVRDIAGIDVADSAARLSRWLNDRIRVMAARSKWIRAEVDFGDTVADQAAYAIPSNVGEIEDLKVGDIPYERVGLRTSWERTAGHLRRNVKGLFSPTFDGAGVKQVRLDPTPADAGTQITGMSVLIPATITGATEPPFPRQFDMPLVYGTVALGLRLDEGNHADAEPFDASFDTAVEELRRLANKHLSSRNQQALISGVNFP